MLAKLYYMRLGQKVLPRILENGDFGHCIPPSIDVYFDSKTIKGKSFSTSPRARVRPMTMRDMLCILKIQRGKLFGTSKKYVYKVLHELNL